MLKMRPSCTLDTNVILYLGPLVHGTRRCIMCFVFILQVFGGASVMPRSKEGKKRTPVDEVSLKKAIEAVKSNDSEKKNVL